MSGKEQFKHFKATGKHLPSLEQMLREMDLCRATFDIAHAKASRDPDELLLGGSNSKTSVVHSAHDISLMWNGPKINTSPGSQFSHLCAMLYECASGKRDESLAGAIARYARSEKRYKLEKAELQFREEDALSDNFSDQRNEINRSREAIAMFESLLKAKELDGLARHLLSEKIGLAKHKIGRSEKSYGPNQVYLSDMTPAQVEELGIDKIDPQSLWKADIAIGNLRRARRAASK